MSRSGVMTDTLLFSLRRRLFQISTRSRPFGRQGYVAFQHQGKRLRRPPHAKEGRVQLSHACVCVCVCVCVGTIFSFFSVFIVILETFSTFFKTRPRVGQAHRCIFHTTHVLTANSAGRVDWAQPRLPRQSPDKAAAEYRYDYGYDMPRHVLAQRMADLAQIRTQSAGKRSYASMMILCSVDAEKALAAKSTPQGTSVAGRAAGAVPGDDDPPGSASRMTASSRASTPRRLYHGAAAGPLRLQGQRDRGRCRREG